MIDTANGIRYERANLQGKAGKTVQGATTRYDLV